MPNYTISVWEEPTNRYGCKTAKHFQKKPRCSLPVTGKTSTGEEQPLTFWSQQSHPAQRCGVNVTLAYLNPNQRFTSGFCARRAAAGSLSAGRWAPQLPWTAGDGQLRLRFSGCAAPTAGVTGEQTLHRRPMECLCMSFFHSRANVEIFTI